METTKDNARRPVLTKSANLWRGNEAVGGKMHLSRDGILFSSHGSNVQTGDTVIPLRDIAGVAKCNTLGIVPNGLKILTRTGEVFQFVLWGRDSVIACIELLMDRNDQHENTLKDAVGGGTDAPSPVAPVRSVGEIQKQEGQGAGKDHGVLPYVLGGIAVLLFLMLRNGCSSTCDTPDKAAYEAISSYISNELRTTDTIKMLGIDPADDGLSATVGATTTIDGGARIAAVSRIGGTPLSDGSRAMVGWTLRVRKVDGEWSEIECILPCTLKGFRKINGRWIAKP